MPKVPNTKDGLSVLGELEKEALRTNTLLAYSRKVSEGKKTVFVKSRI